MLSSDNGYPLQWFVEWQSLDDYLKCGICGNVLRDPRATRCGHVFCLSCLLGWIDAYGICPQRCGEVEADQMKRALHIEKRISGLLTLCKYQQYGCAVQVPLVDKALHESTCPYNRTRRLPKSVSHQPRSGRSHESQGDQTQVRKASPKRTRSSAGTGASHHTAVQTKSGATTKRSPTFCSTRTCQLQHQQRIPTGMVGLQCLRVDANQQILTLGIFYRAAKYLNYCFVILRTSPCIVLHLCCCRTISLQPCKPLR